MVGRHTRCFLAACLATTVGGAAAHAALRVVTYNVDADVDRDGDGAYTIADGTYATGAAASVLEAIGAYSLAGNVQAPDVISVQEPYGTPSVTLGSIVANLNTFYGAGTYDYDPTVGATTDSTAIGNGSNGMIFRVATVKVDAVKQVGTPSGSGEARSPLRYQLRALAATANNTFYVYDEHAKASSTGTLNAQRRAIEADAVRADADALGAAAHVIYTGDFNLAGQTVNNVVVDTGSAEQAYRDLTAAAGTTLYSNGTSNGGAAIVAGAARALDPQASTFDNSDAAYVKYYTESDTNLTARFDLQLTTANTLPGSASPGLRLIDKSYLAFGNAYYTSAGVLSTVNPVGGSIYRSANYNTAVTGYSAATLNALIAASDHLPVVADYVIVVPEPTTLGTIALVVTVLRSRR